MAHWHWQWIVVLLAAVVVGEGIWLLRHAARWHRLKRFQAQWKPPSLDAGRYQVVMHYNGQTRELASGFDGVAVRHAFEDAALQPGVVVEFYEWGQCRGRKSA